MPTITRAHKRSSLFGPIAVLISISALKTPQFMLAVVFIALALFVVIGLWRDSNKLFSLAALLIGGSILYYLAEQELNRQDQYNTFYNVRYEVECDRCDVSFTSYSGGAGVERDVKGKWSRTVQIGGDEPVQIEANNYAHSFNAHVAVYVNDEIMDNESATGEYSSAQAGCRPREINEK